MGHEITLGMYAARWMYLSAHRLKPRTREVYGYCLTTKILPTLGAGTPLKTLTRAKVREALVSLLDAGYSGTTVSVVLGVLRAMLNSARYEDEILGSNPAERMGRLVPKRKGPRAGKPIPRTALDAFLVEARRIHDAIGILLLLSARTGLRLGEVLGLMWTDVDLDRRIVCVQRSLDWRHVAGTPKNGETAYLPLSPHTVDALRQLRDSPRKPCPWLFPGPSGRPLSRTRVGQVIDEACRAAAIPRTTHRSLRNSFAADLAQRGVDPWRVRDLMRHRTIAMTESYVGTVPKESLAVVDGLDWAG